MGLTMSQRRAVTKTIATRYKRADKAAKVVNLDELDAKTGWDRNHARKAPAAALHPQIVRRARMPSSTDVLVTDPHSVMATTSAAKEPLRGPVTERNAWGRDGQPAPIACRPRVVMAYRTDGTVGGDSVSGDPPVDVTVAGVWDRSHERQVTAPRHPRQKKAGLEVEHLAHALTNAETHRPWQDRSSTRRRLPGLSQPLGELAHQHLAPSQFEILQTMICRGTS